MCRRGLAGSGQPGRTYDALEDVNKAADNKRRANAATLFAQLKSKSDQRQAHAVKAAPPPRVAPPPQTPTQAVSAQPIQIRATEKRPLHDPDAVRPLTTCLTYKMSA